jgi:predicted dehydrogenase
MGFDAGNPMNPPSNEACAMPGRRGFLRTTGSLAALLAAGQAPQFLRAESLNAASRVRVAVLGLGRGLDHISGYAPVASAEIAAVCDVDQRRLAAGVKAVEAKTGRTPAAVKDFHRILEDRSIDAVSIALPNFWHAPMTLLALSAGKHVYVEKPGSHNAREAGWMAAAATRHGRKVQMGNQRRSVPEIREAMERLKSGVIGPVRYARSWYDANRPGIGRGKPVPVPEWLDYALWQGPIPERPYVDNLVHYNWHWRWHWGGGELANNGIHALDLVRWGLGVVLPTRVSVSGGRYHFQDDQETPDTIVANFDFGHCGASWDSSSCLPRKEEAHPFVTFYGDGGSLSIDLGAGYRVFDLKGKETFRASGRFSDVPHFTNFIEGIRSGTPLNSEIREAQHSTMLCHLGNIAYRTGSVLETDPATGEIRNATPAQRKLWGREYRRGWEPRA